MSDDDEQDDDREDDEPDPGPHTHIYVGTDRGDECELCGRMRDQSADLGDEWDLHWDGSALGGES